LITFLPENRRCEERIGDTLLDLALKSKIEVISVCGGLGACGKCKVRVVKGREFLSPISHKERSFLTIEDISSGYRLACQAKVLKKGEIEVEIPVTSRRGAYILQVEGIETPVTLSPSVKRICVKVKKPALKSVKSDHDLLLEALKTEARSISISCLRSLPVVLRNEKWEVSAILYKDEIIDVRSKKAKVLGFAVDLGSTKLAGYLLDLETGKTLGKTSRLNPQVRYGEDILTRITHIMKDKRKLSVLRALLLKAVNEMIRELVKAVNASTSDVYEVVAVGNTYMHHSFLGIDPSYLALSPYPPVVRKALTYDAKEVGLTINEGGKVYVLPNIAGFVGADCVAAILATEIYKLEKPCLMIDIGTNTEIVLNDGKGLFAVSTASGPAFEGAHIKFGVRAMIGAIESVAIRNCDVLYRTIGNGKPVGICGSGILDAISQMVEHSILDESGRLNENVCKELVKRDGGIKELILVDKDKTAINEDITISQKDIREIQKAKAAIATGIKVLLNNRGISSDDLEAVFIAGAFGTYLDPLSAIKIGMLPRVPLVKIHQVGNAAGTGARMCLLSDYMKRKAEDVAGKVNYIELAVEPYFQEIYLDSIKLKEYNI